MAASRGRVRSRAGWALQCVKRERDVRRSVLGPVRVRQPALPTGTACRHSSPMMSAPSVWKSCRSRVSRGGPSGPLRSTRSSPTWPSRVPAASWLTGVPRCRPSAKYARSCERPVARCLRVRRRRPAVRTGKRVGYSALGSRAGRLSVPLSASTPPENTTGDDAVKGLTMPPGVHHAQPHRSDGVDNDDVAPHSAGQRMPDAPTNPEAVDVGVADHHRVGSSSSARASITAIGRPARRHPPPSAAACDLLRPVHRLVDDGLGTSAGDASQPISVSMGEATAGRG